MVCTGRRDRGGGSGREAKGLSQVPELSSPCLSVYNRISAASRLNGLFLGFNFLPWEGLISKSNATASCSVQVLAASCDELVRSLLEPSPAPVGEIIPVKLKVGNGPRDNGGGERLRAAEGIWEPNQCPVFGGEPAGPRQTLSPDSSFPKKPAPKGTAQAKLGRYIQSDHSPSSLTQSAWSSTEKKARLKEVASLILEQIPL